MNVSPATDARQTTAQRRGPALAAAFQQQMQEAAAGIFTDAGADPSGGGASSGESDGDPFGLASIASAQMTPMLLPALMQAGLGDLLMGIGESSDGASGGAGALAGVDLLGQAGGSGGMPAAATPSRDAAANAAVVADVARRNGVDPALAVAMMLVESGGDNRAIGDGGTSFGLFQLHKGGMLTAAGLSPAQATDPAVNAGVALRSLSRTLATDSWPSPGAAAAASQRPADPAGYARKVDAHMDAARQLLADR